MPAEKSTTHTALARTRDSAARAGRPFTTATASEKGRITVDLGEQLYRRFKATAAMHGRQMNEVVRELVTAWLEEHPLS